MKAHSSASRLCVGLTATLALSCSTIRTKGSDDPPYWGVPYSGIRYDYWGLWCTESLDRLGLDLLYIPLDFPFSLIADTLLLPVDLTLFLTHQLHKPSTGAVYCGTGECVQSAIPDEDNTFSCSSLSWFPL